MTRPLIRARLSEEGRAFPVADVMTESLQLCGSEIHRAGRWVGSPAEGRHEGRAPVNGGAADAPPSQESSFGAWRIRHRSADVDAIVAHPAAPLRCREGFPAPGADPLFLDASVVSRTRRALPPSRGPAGRA